MPTYEYACRACGEHLEVVQGFSDDPLSSCPSCGGELRKVFGSVGIVFKGSGFYKTDNRSAGSSAKASTAPAGEQKSAEAKPAQPAPAESKPAEAKTPAPASAGAATSS